MKLKGDRQISCNCLRVIIDHTRKNDWRIILGEEDFGNAVQVPFHNSSVEAVLSSIESCTCFNHALDHWSIGVATGSPKLERDMRQKALDTDR